MDKALEDYRTHLITAEQKAQEDFDKTVVSLSGGALGISFAFLKDIVGNHPIAHKGLLFTAWISWGLSISLVLSSYFTSHLALCKSIDQIDNAVRNSNINQIYTQRAGGRFSLITSILNAVGGLLFFVGILFIAVFVWHNLETK